MNKNDVYVVIPTYNNAKTLCGVIDSVLESGLPVIVVNDGATDNTQQIISLYHNRIELIEYTPNRGKGYALMQGFMRAAKLGAKYAITIDSDGQHDAGDIAKFLERIDGEADDIMIVGARGFGQEHMPKGNTFANRFSNFWFTLQTAIKLPDTQSGFRLYPLKKVSKMKLFTSRYESELEMMVRLAWSGTKIVSLPITVYYTQDRVTHFRPTVDFMRISLLNTVLTILSVFYGHPRKLITKLIR